jgi:pilus assembly protein CpaB
VRNWRVLTAVAAVVLACLAGVLVWKYTDDAKKDAEAPYEKARVLVAAKKVPANTSFASALDNGLIVVDERVQEALPPTRVIEDTDTNLKSRFNTLVAAHDISPGETVVREDFVPQGKALNGLNGQLQNDQDKDKANQLQAVSVTLDDQRAVGGFLQPGDTVNILFQGEIGTQYVSSGDVKVKTTSFMLPGVKVLAVGSTTAAPVSASTASATDGSTPPTTPLVVSRNIITFEVNSRQALQIVHAQNAGSLYLTLNPSSFKKGSFRAEAEVVEAINLFDQPLPVVDRALAAALAAKNAGK